MFRIRTGLDEVLNPTNLLDVGCLHQAGSKDFILFLFLLKLPNQCKDGITINVPLFKKLRDIIFFVGQ